MADVEVMEPTQATGQPHGEGERLLPVDYSQECRTQWDRIQTGFVDQPKSAVEEADKLVTQAIQRLSDTFSEEKARLSRQWDRGEDVSTEDLRLALQRYRSFFNRLLNI